jgi:predicted nucleic-acid-binding Zn-ribbon protein
MSEKISCQQCGMLLYYGEEIKRRLYMRAIPNEAAVLAAYGNACPRCGNALADKSVKVEIKRRAVHES